MIDLSDIPDWAIEKAMDQSYRGAGWRAKDVKSYGESIPLCGVIIAFARYIAEHEEAPVDPIEHEAQQIADDIGLNLSAMPRVERALHAALRRGIELASTNASREASDV